MTTDYIEIQPARAGEFLPASLINAHSALTVPAYWRGINFLVDTLTSFPIAVYRDGAKLDAPHPLRAMFRLRPNRYQTAFVFWRTLYLHIFNYGNGYARIERAGMAAAALHNLNPEDIVPFRQNGLQWYYQKSEKRVFNGADVLHIMGLGFDGMVGYSPVNILADTFARAKLTDQFMIKYLKKGTYIRGGIEVPTGTSDEVITEIITNLRKYTGVEAERDVMVLTGGAKLSNNTINPRDSQLLEQCEFTTKQIAQVIGVPPQFLYEFGESKYNNSIEQMGQDVVRFTLRPWIMNIGNELTVKLLTPKEQEDEFTVQLNPDALVQGDTKTQSDIISAQVNGGLRTTNEGRKKLGLPPDSDPASDKLRLPTHLVANPNAQPPATTRQENTRPTAADAFDALKPVIMAGIDRVETKTRKAFDNASKKPADQRTVWANVFSAEQQRFAADTFDSVAQAIESLTTKRLDVNRLADQYAGSIRAQAAGREAKTLAQLVEENTHEQQS